MQHTVTIRMSVDDRLETDEIEYAARQAAQTIHEYDGFEDVELVGVTTEEPTVLQEEQAIKSVLSSIDEDDDLATKLEKAQEMAYLMVTDETIMDLNDE